MGYRPPSVEPRGAWAKAIHRKRRELNVSQQRAFEMLGASLGFGPKSRAAYIALDMGQRPPTEAESKVLAEWLGGYPEEPSTAGSDIGRHTPFDPAAYLERIDALVGSVSELVAEVRAARQERDDLLERVGALEAAARLRERSGDGAGDGTPAPHQTGE